MSKQSTKSEKLRLKRLFKGYPNEYDLAIARMNARRRGRLIVKPWAPEDIPKASTERPLPELTEQAVKAWKDFEELLDGLLERDEVGDIKAGPAETDVCRRVYQASRELLAGLAHCGLAAFRGNWAGHVMLRIHSDLPTWVWLILAEAWSYAEWAYPLCELSIASWMPVQASLIWAGLERLRLAQVKAGTDGLSPVTPGRIKNLVEALEEDAKKAAAEDRAEDAIRRVAQCLLHTVREDCVQTRDGCYHPISRDPRSTVELFLKVICVYGTPLALERPLRRLWLFLSIDAGQWRWMADDDAREEWSSYLKDHPVRFPGSLNPAHYEDVVATLRELAGKPVGQIVIAEVKAQEVKLIKRSLAQAVPEGKTKQKLPAVTFPTPPEGTWEQVRIVWAEDGATVTVGVAHKRYGFAEMGFGNKQKKQHAPDAYWKFLGLLAHFRGRLSWETEGVSQQGKDNVKAKISVIRKRLRAFFGIPDDPFWPYSKQDGYVTRFTISTREYPEFSTPPEAGWADVTITIPREGHFRFELDTASRTAEYVYERGSQNGRSGRPEAVQQAGTIDKTYDFRELGLSDQDGKPDRRAEALKRVVQGGGRISASQTDPAMAALCGFLSNFLGIQHGSPFDYRQGQWIAKFETHY